MGSESANGKSHPNTDGHGMHLCSTDEFVKMVTVAISWTGLNVKQWNESCTILLKPITRVFEDGLEATAPRSKPTRSLGIRSPGANTKIGVMMKLRK